MHIDLEHGAPARMDADVAVIGAGAAGLTIARRMLAHGLSVILLESGGLDYEAETAALNRGGSVGESYYDLEDARLRFFGGTTAIWGGRVAELDPIDFMARDWVPHSGWPLRYEDLQGYYREARALLDLPAEFAAAPPIPFDPDVLSTPTWLFDNRSDRFAFARCADLMAHPRCRIVTHATVREIVAGASGQAIERLDVASLNGRTLDVRARDYVLAAGGIENPRLLLASRSVFPAGLGNARDLVGRFFMEHPHTRGGRIVGRASWQWLRAFGKHRASDGTSYAHLISPAAALQRRAGLLNSSLTIAARRPADGEPALLMRAYLNAKHKISPTKSGRTLWRATKRTARAVQRITDPLRPWALHKLGKLDITLVVRAEQAPNRDSRVRLAPERDSLGVPGVQLDWRTSGLDVSSVAGLVGAFGQEARRLGLGTVEPAAWLEGRGQGWQTDPLVSAHPIGGYHHMGTTRMSDGPAGGVVDPDGRVHGLGNLFVVGSSVFPTGGWANPTLTIIALALRTGDRLLAVRRSRASQSREARTAVKGDCLQPIPETVPVS